MAVEIIQEIMTGFDVTGNPTRVADKVVLARRHTVFSDGTVTIEEFVVEDEDKEVEKSLPNVVEVPIVEEPTENQFPINFDRINSVGFEEIEKALFGLFRGVLRPLVTFVGKRGAWVTHRGRPLFIEAKRQTVFNIGKNIPKRDVDLVRGVFDSFPDAVKDNITLVRIRGSRGLTSKMSKRQLKRISSAREEFFDSVVIQGGEYNNATGTLTIWPESTRIGRKLRGKPDLALQTIREIQTHEGGHALFRGVELKGESFARRLVDFRGTSLREGGVTNYSQLYRNFLTAGTQAARGQKVTSATLARPFQPGDIPKFGTPKFTEWETTHGRVYATENFAETYKIYLGRTGRRKADWARIRRDKPATVKSFLNILEEANAK